MMDGGALVGQVGRVASAEVVEANAGQLQPHHEALEVPLRNIVRVERFAVRLAEDEATVLIGCASNLRCSACSLRSRVSSSTSAGGIVTVFSLWVFVSPQICRPPRR